MVSEPRMAPFERRLHSLRRRVAILRGDEHETDRATNSVHSLDLEGIASGLEDLALDHRAMDGELRRYRQVFRHARHAYLITTAAGVITEANPASVSLLQGKLFHLVGKPLVRFVGRESLRDVLECVVQVARGEEPREREIHMRRRSQAPFLALVAVAPIRDAADNLVALHWTLQDITERKAVEEGLAHRANHDELTGLANRSLFEAGLELALARARRSGLGVSVLSLDLDRFKTVNDSLGHAVGDEVLRQTAMRLARAARATDIVARVGGDEFMVLLGDLGVDDDGRPSEVRRSPELVADRIREALKVPCTVAALEIHITASIGIGLLVGDAGDKATLMNRADSAMYRSKRDPQRGYVLNAGIGDTLAEFGDRLRDWLDHHPDQGGRSRDTSSLLR